MAHEAVNLGEMGANPTDCPLPDWCKSSMQSCHGCGRGAVPLSGVSAGSYKLGERLPCKREAPGSIPGRHIMASKWNYAFREKWDYVRVVVWTIGAIVIADILMHHACVCI